MLNEIEQQSLDIDWFFTNNHQIAFVASGGGRLPNSIVNLSESRLLSSFFRRLPVTSDVVINPLLNNIKGFVANDQYLSDFIYMAKRGLFSFDKSVLNDFLDCNYHLVAKPIISLNLELIPDDIKAVLMKSQYVGNIDWLIDSGKVT